MIFHAEEEKPKKGQLVFCEFPTENGKTAWLIYHFVNKFPFKIIRWFSVSDIEQAEKRIDFLEEKVKRLKRF